MPRETLRLPRVPVGFRIRSGQTVVEAVPEIVAPPEPVVAKPVEPKQPDVAELIAALKESVDEFEHRRQQSLRELQQAAVELALAAAGHVVGIALLEERSSVEELVSMAIDRIGVIERAQIRLHPNDLARLQSASGPQSMKWLNDRITLTADATLKIGALRLDAESGRVLLTDVTTRLNQVREEWQEVLHDAQVECRRAADGTSPVRRFPDRRETA